MQQINIARHPVLDSEQELFGYELQFRDPRHPGSDPSALAREFPTTLVDTIDSPEFAKLLGDRAAFVHVTPNFVEKGFADLLPKDRIILELLQTMEANEDLVQMLNQASGLGFRLVFSLLLADPDYFPVFEAVDFVKVDLNLFEGEELDHLLQMLQGFPARLIAENVHTREAFDQAVAKGFDLFQGQFFAKPAQITTETLPAQKTALLTLYRQITGDAEFSDIESTFKDNPDLSYKLLRLINSAAFHRPKEIHSIRQALAMLGKRNLRKWVALLLYSGAGRGGNRNPLLEEAVVRGRMMELAASKLTDDPNFAESAFITGTFSVIEALLGRPLAQIVEEVNLDDDIGEALLEHKGVLGDLLATTMNLRENRILPEQRPENLYELSDADIYSYEEQATREFEDLDDLGDDGSA